MAAVESQADASTRRAQVMERFARKLDKYLPEEGELRPWKLAEIELELKHDMHEVGRDIMESRIDVDPQRLVEKPRCPDCGAALAGVDHSRSAHKHTIIGPIRFTRTYGVCHVCDVAFSPSGQRVELREGLL